MTEDDVNKINSMISDLRFIQENSQSGAEPEALRRTATAIREIKDGYLGELWRKAGFVKNPMIQNTFIDTDKFNNDYWAYAIVFNARDHIPDDPYAVVSSGHQWMGGAFTLVDENGHRIGGTGSTDFHFEGHESYNSWELFVDKYVPLPKYFEKTILYYNGLTLNRHELLNYVAYNRWGVHYGKPKPMPKDKLELLNDYLKVKEVNRDTVWTMYLGIVQNILRSEDIQKFMDWKP